MNARAALRIAGLVAAVRGACADSYRHQVVCSAARAGRGASSPPLRGSSARASASRARRSAAHACSSPTTSAGSTSSCSAARPAARSSPRTSSAIPFIHWLADQNAHRLRQAQPRARARRTRRSPSPRRSRARSRSRCSRKARPGPGTHLLPFRSTLLEAANFAAKDVAIRPVALDYGARGGGDRLVAKSRARTMCCGCSAGAGTLPVTVHLLEPLDRSGDRKQLAAEAREAIAQTLGLTSPAHSPIGGRE